eukprot:scaffold131831_cov23-Tisochrysis_lutea.AAC.1
MPIPRHEIWPCPIFWWTSLRLRWSGLVTGPAQLPSSAELLLFAKTKEENTAVLLWDMASHHPSIGGTGMSVYSQHHPL